MEGEPLREEDALRQQAIKRIKEKRELVMHAVAYVVVNAMLIGIWAMSGQGYFWPMWVLLGWGVGLAMHVAAFFFENKPIREGEIEREMRHLGGGDSTSA